MTSNRLARRSIHPALLYCEPVGESLATRPPDTNKGRFEPVHLSRCVPVDSGLRVAPPHDIACAECSAAPGYLNSP